MTRSIITWSGPTNSLAATNVDYLYASSTNCAITGITGGVAGKMNWATLTVSNSTGGAITVSWTGAGNAVGSSTTNSLSVPAAKQAMFSIWVRANARTNYINVIEQ